MLCLTGYHLIRRMIGCMSQKQPVNKYYESCKSNSPRFKFATLIINLIKTKVRDANVQEEWKWQDDMLMALFRVRDGFISAQVSEIFHEPLGEWKIGDECWDNPSCTRNNTIWNYGFSRTISDVLWTFKRFYNFIFHLVSKWRVCFGVREQ